MDENYLRESILEPQAKIRAGYKPVMPTYQGQLKDEEICGLDRLHQKPYGTKEVHTMIVSNTSQERLEDIAVRTQRSTT